MRKIGLILILWQLTACQSDAPSLMKKQYYIFGTVVEILVWHNDSELVGQALSAVEKQLNAMHHQWHAWKPGRLYDINQSLRADKAHNITQKEADFIQRTKTLSQQSLGYFNPAIGELIHLWGFHTDDYPITAPPPSDGEITNFLQHSPSMQDLLINTNSISSNNPHIWLDFGGIAKGYAIDQAIETLLSFGLSNAIVNAGGDLRSIGRKGQIQWKVAVRKPNSEDILAVIEVQGDESVFTSGNYARYKIFNEKRYAHIIDPHSGYGIDEIVSATVIADDGVLADAAATAVIVAGIENWQKVAESMQLSQVLLLDANGKCHATKKMMSRLTQSDLKCTLANR